MTHCAAREITGTPKPTRTIAFSDGQEYVIARREVDYEYSSNRFQAQSEWGGRKEKTCRIGVHAGEEA
jgi:hypothetical protein